VKEADLGKWVVGSSVGSQKYTFDDDFKLKAGSTVTIWSGTKNKSKDNPPNSIFWTGKYIWNDKGDAATLKSADGEKELDKISSKVCYEKQGVVISKLDLIDEYVTLTNYSDSDVDLKGWSVRDRGDKFHYVFSDTTLKGGQSVCVWSGRNSDKKDNAPHSLAWTKRYIWNNSGDSAALYDNEGNLVDKIMVIPEEFPEKIEPPTSIRK